MATYKTTIKKFEEAKGSYEITFIISDSYSGISSASAIDINIIENIRFSSPGTVKTLRFMVNSLHAQGNIDIEAYRYIKNCLDSGSPLYCAVFVDSEELSSDDLLFSGKISDEYRSEDIKWPTTQWDQTGSFIRNYYLTAHSYSEDILESIDLREIISLMNKSWNDSTSEWQLDTGWEEAHVTDRPGWFDDGSGRKVMVHQLVSLDHLLRRFADIAEQHVYNQGLGEINISYDSCKIDGSFFPARWSHPSLNGKTPRYVMFSNQDTPTHNRPFDVFSDDGMSLYISPDIDESTLTAEEIETRMKQTIWLDYKQIRRQVDLIDGEEMDFEPDSAIAESYRWSNACQDEEFSFAKFLKLLAANLNLKIDVDYNSEGNISINFLGNNDYLKSMNYIMDAGAASLKKSAKATNSASLTGKANYLANEGNSQYYISNQQGTEPYRQANDFSITTARERLLLTLSPTQAIITTGADDGLGSIDFARLPHNHYHQNNSTMQTGIHQRAIGLHSAIYLYVDKRFTSSDEPDSYWTPAAGLAIKIDNEEKYFSKMSDYLYFISSRDHSGIEYSITTNNLFGVSGDETGNPADWKLWMPGNQIMIDDIPLTITDCQYDIQSSIIKLKLTGSSRFSQISEPTTPAISQPDDRGKQQLHAPPVEKYTVNSEVYNADGYIPAGACCSRTVDNKVEFSKANSDHYGRLIGFSVDRAADGDEVVVQYSGKITQSAWPDLTPGEPVFLRDVSDEMNISQSPLTEADGFENLAALIGRATAQDTIIIDISKQLILE